MLRRRALIGCPFRSRLSWRIALPWESLRSPCASCPQPTPAADPTRDPETCARAGSRTLQRFPSGNSPSARRSPNTGVVPRPFSPLSSQSRWPLSQPPSWSAQILPRLRPSVSSAFLGTPPRTLQEMVRSLRSFVSRLFCELSALVSLHWTEHPVPISHSAVAGLSAGKQLPAPLPTFCQLRGPAAGWFDGHFTVTWLRSHHDLPSV